MRAAELLLEYDRSKTEQNFRDKIVARLLPKAEDSSTMMWMTARKDWQTILAHHDGNRIEDVLQQMRSNSLSWQDIVPSYLNFAVDFVMDVCELNDPTNKKAFVINILNWWIQGMLVEDFYKIKEALETYSKFRNRITANLSTIDYREFIEKMDHEAKRPSLADLDKNQEQEMYKMGDARLIEDNATYKIVIPLTKEGAIFFGQHTKWCTSASSSANMFKHYSQDGSLYIILFKKDNRRWQLHFETGQYMDELDQPLSHDELAASPIANWFDDKIRDKIKYGEGTLSEMLNPTWDDMKMAVEGSPTLAGRLWYAKNTAVTNTWVSIEQKRNINSLATIAKKLTNDQMDELIRIGLKRFRWKNGSIIQHDRDRQEARGLLDCLTSPTAQEVAELEKLS